jgi:DNA-binding IclR family transcriptional regulator
VLLAHLPESEAERLTRLQGFIRYNDNTIGTFRKLKHELAQVRTHGYSLDDEEEEIGIRCLGAPVLNGVGQAIAAISIVGDTAHISEETIPALKVQLIGAADRISELLRRGQHEVGAEHADPSFDLPGFEAVVTRAQA